MITFIIDDLTECLKDSITGESLETEVIELKRKSLLSRFNSKNGWYVNWGTFPDGVRVFALVLKGTFDIQGLIAIEPDYEAKAVHILWACTAPQNNKWRYGFQKYIGVGGHLFAIAAELSEKYGFEGYLYGASVLPDKVVADGKVITPNSFEWSVDDPKAVGFEPVGIGARCRVWPIAPTAGGGATLTIVNPETHLELSIPVYVLD